MAASKEQLFNHFQTDNKYTNTNFNLNANLKYRYTNFNLNANLKCPVLNPVQSYSKSYNDKNCDSVVSDIYKETTKFQACNKSLDFCLNSLKLYDETDEEKPQNCWKTSKYVSNKSTLSLHISAYENSTEAADVAASDGGLKGTTLNANTKQVFTATSAFIFGNLFEFPRQQNNKIHEPEVSQYRSSQQLRNPNAGNLCFQLSYN
uniref:PIR Superfamily Protein n=1 Tax=Panagrolaimus sp. PS1159 TaxID=55785 RepID=A0AC35GIR3_9BILA